MANGFFTALQRMTRFNFLRASEVPSYSDDPLAEKARLAFQGLSRGPHVSGEQAGKMWHKNTERLVDLAIHHDIKRFLQWDVVVETMVANNTSPYINNELAFLQRLPDWEERWEPALVESPVGTPAMFPSYPNSSGNLIHHAYHLAQLEKTNGIRVNELGHVFEFGGGYGSMCRLFYNLGFKGAYIIFDLPAFSELQRYFLGSIGLPVVPSDQMVPGDSLVACISGMDRLQEILPAYCDVGGSAFIAAWSFSESPLRIRNRLMPFLKGYQHIFIGYQDQFDDVDNRKFFGDWPTRFPDFSWKTWSIDHLAGCHYLIGKATRG
jgi:hypothetical protein